MKYKGNIIEGETDPWPLKYGLNFKFYHPDGEVIHTADTLKDAKDRIDEGNLNNDYDPNPDAWSGGICDNH